MGRSGGFRIMGAGLSRDGVESIREEEEEEPWGMRWGR